jgi:2OG-Fe(II) oxygenase superfamily
MEYRTFLVGALCLVTCCLTVFFIFSQERGFNKRDFFLTETKKILTAEECQYIIDYTESNGLFSRSTIFSHNGSSLVDTKRTSWSCFLPAELPISHTVVKRVYELTRIAPNRYELVHIARYSVGEEYKPHFDTDPPLLARTDTVLIYLNDDFPGGETLFTHEGKVVRPEMGKALWWKNEDERGNVLKKSKHAGLPVLSGAKYVLTIWIRREAN